MSVITSSRLRSRLSGPRRVTPAVRPVRRVRQEVRDGLMVVAFSAVASSAVAVILATLPRLAG